MRLGRQTELPVSRSLINVQDRDPWPLPRSVRKPSAVHAEMRFDILIT